MLFIDDLQQGLSAEQQLYFGYRLGASISQQEIDVLKQENNTLKTEVTTLQDEISRLKEQLNLAQHRQFGKKSEVGEPVLDKEHRLIQISAHARKKKTKGRLIDLSLLPRFRVFHDLSEDEKSCASCHKTLKRMGEDVSEQVEVLPQRLYVQEHVRYKYSCSACETISMSPKEKAPIPKALAGGSLLTEVIINKYQYHLPLYRQSKILASLSAVIPDNTLGNWVMNVGNGLMKIYQAYWDAMIATSYLQVDETPIKILKPNQNGYLWSYFAPYIGNSTLAIFG